MSIYLVRLQITLSEKNGIDVHAVRYIGIQKVFL